MYGIAVKHPMTVRVISECFLDAIDGAGDISLCKRHDGYRHFGRS